MKSKSKNIPLGKKQHKQWTMEQKYTYSVRLFYVVLLLCSSLIQNTAHLFPTIFGAHAFLLIPAVVCISMFERDMTATVMGVLAGAFWDIYSAWGDGFHAILMMLSSTVVCLLLNYVMRNNLVTALILGAGTVFLYLTFMWLFFCLARGVDGTGLAYLTYYLPSALYTFLFTPVYYIVVRAVLVRLRDRFPRRSKVRRP